MQVHFAGKCFQFLKQRKTWESKTCINSPEGTASQSDFSCLCMHPIQIPNATGCREKYFQTVNMLCFILICLFGCLDSSQCCSISN